MKDNVVREFHRLFYERGLHANYGRGLHAETRYHGIEAHKCPLDLWIFQEILCDVRPQLVIELGTYLGGTTLFLAHQLDALGGGQVVSVDCRELPRPTHARIRYVLGQTTAPDVVAIVTDLARSTSGPVLIIHVRGAAGAVRKVWSGWPDRDSAFCSGIGQPLSNAVPNSIGDGFIPRCCEWLGQDYLLQHAPGSIESCVAIVSAT